jgi:hypothetical protein
MSSGSRKHPIRPTEPLPVLRWRSWPLREDLLAALILLIILAVIGLGVRWLTGRTELGLLASCVFLVAMWRYFLPVSFELNSDGVNQWVLGRHRRIPWKLIRQYKVCSRGVLLLPHADYRPVDALRGLYLPWGEHRDEVLTYLRHYLDRSAEL